MATAANIPVVSTETFLVGGAKVSYYQCQKDRRHQRKLLAF